MKSLSRSISEDPSFPTSSGWTLTVGPAAVDAVDSAVVRDDTDLTVRETGDSDTSSW